jgi:hypothetical protein
MLMNFHRRGRQLDLRTDFFVYLHLDTHEIRVIASASFATPGAKEVLLWRLPF